MEERPIIIGAAVDTELDYLLRKLENKIEEQIDGYIFWKGKFDSFPIIIYRTEVGTINAAISTYIAVKQYKPLLIINEGTAGAHMENLNTADIVVGREIISIDAYKSVNRKIGEGINPFEWKIAGFRHEKSIGSDEKLLEFVSEMKKYYNEGKVYIGRIGSGNVFNKEVDRIKDLNKRFNTMCEEMEGIGVYKICERLRVPVIGFRVISNNEILGLSYDVAYGKYGQVFTYEFVKRYIKKFREVL